MLVPAVQPDVEPVLLRAMRIEPRGYNQSVGLDRAVDSRHVAAHEEAGRACPGCFTFAQLRSSFPALLQQTPSDLNFVAPVKLVVAQRPIHGFVKNLHIREEVELVGLVLQDRKSTRLNSS